MTEQPVQPFEEPADPWPNQEEPRAGIEGVPQDPALEDGENR